jgi:fatty-acyl-CoA synthase
VSAENNLIWQAFDRPGDDRPQLHCWEGGHYRAMTWDGWRRGAERATAGLQALGIRPGSRVAAVLTNAGPVCQSIPGVWLAGATLLSLPTLRRGMTAEEYTQQLKKLCVAANVQLMLLEDRFMGMLDPESFGIPLASFSSLDRDVTVKLAPLDDDAPAFVQYSSGSTSDPKGVVLSMRAIARQEAMLAEGLSLDRDSQGVVWLPLSHDMGLFGCLLLSWATGAKLALGTPERFLRRPKTWFDDAADFGATIVVAPNFGLALASRTARATPPKGGCPLETFVLGGERIELETLEAAHEVLGPYGVALETLTPAYGLAEGTLGVTMKPHLEVPRTAWIDREKAYGGELSLADPNQLGSTAVVSCGPQMRDVVVGIDDEPIGRIHFSSGSLADGYLDDPTATAASFHDGRFQTEDLGFVYEGELYVLGRTDDVIVFAGRNVHARDVERQIEALDGVRSGCAALVDDRRDGEPRIALLVEPARSEIPDLRTLADEAVSIAFHSAGLSVAECVLVQPGRLPKTPSGKIQRFRCRTLIGDDGAVLERVQS